MKRIVNLYSLLYAISDASISEVPRFISLKNNKFYDLEELIAKGNDRADLLKGLLEYEYIMLPMRPYKEINAEYCNSMHLPVKPNEENFDNDFESYLDNNQDIEKDYLRKTEQIFLNMAKKWCRDNDFKYEIK